jgi:hypothetical protein
METSGGYPEEQPEQSPSGDDPREKDSPRRDEAPGGGDNAPDNDDGTATGNPGAAGSDE